MRAEGFGPVYDQNSKLLILGSFPSVKSRAEGFYYGNPQNRFWKTLCSFFGESIPETVDGKRAFLLRRGVALWDVVASCEIVGSMDASIANEVTADIPNLLKMLHGVRKIFCNGGKSYELLRSRYPELLPMTTRLSSTSPANPRFSLSEWHAALFEVFGTTTEKSVDKSNEIG